jgi:hypothetical protein
MHPARDDPHQTKGTHRCEDDRLALLPVHSAREAEHEETELKASGFDPRCHPGLKVCRGVQLDTDKLRVLSGCLPTLKAGNWLRFCMWGTWLIQVRRYTPLTRPVPRTSYTPFTPSSAAVSSSSNCAPLALTFSINPSLSVISMTFFATAQLTG